MVYLLEHPMSHTMGHPMNILWDVPYGSHLSIIRFWFYTGIHKILLQQFVAVSPAPPGDVWLLIVLMCRYRL